MTGASTPGATSRSGDLLVAQWTPPGTLEVARPGQEDGPASICPAPSRYAVRLYARTSGTWLRTSHGLAAIGPQLEVRPLPPPPGAAAAGAVWKVLHDGRIALLEDARVCVRADSSWTSLILPRGFAARDVAVDAEGVLWVAGAAQSSRVPRADTEAALLRGVAALEPVPHGIGPLGLARLMRRGALHTYEAVEAWSAPFVLGSRTAWFLDDPSSWLIVGAAGERRIHRLRDRTTRALLPAPDGCVVATGEGDVLLARPDRTLETLVAAPALARAMGATGHDGARPILRGITLTAGGCAVVAGMATDSGERLVWHTTALLAVTTGEPVELLHRTSPERGEPELLDCAPAAF